MISQMLNNPDLLYIITHNFRDKKYLINYRIGTRVKAKKTRFDNVKGNKDFKLYILGK